MTDFSLLLQIMKYMFNTLCISLIIYTKHIKYMSSYVSLIKCAHVNVLRMYNVCMCMFVGKTHQ